MPFGRIHEEAAGDGKLLALSDAAWRMWGMGLVYCQKNLTDGFIPTHAIESFGVRSPNKARIADELCSAQVPDKAPVWSRIAGGFQIHDYLDWNDSKAEILKMRADARDRIKHHRERKRAEQAALQASARNALHGGEQHAHDVVRGSGDLEERKDVARIPTGRQTSGALAGALPREHLKHAACDPTFSLCVPEAVHAKLLSKLAPKHGGDRAAAGAALQAWYPTVWAALAADFVMGDEFKFWQGRFDVAFASKDEAKTQPRSAVPGVDETRARRERMRAEVQ